MDLYPGWWFGTCFFSPHSVGKCWECHHPNWLSHFLFFRGIETTNQIIINHHYPYNNHISYIIILTIINSILTIFEWWRWWRFRPGCGVILSPPCPTGRVSSIPSRLARHWGGVMDGVERDDMVPQALKRWVYSWNRWKSLGYKSVSGCIWVNSDLPLSEKMGWSSTYVSAVACLPCLPKTHEMQ